MNKIFKNKKGASEAFNIILPIFLFAVACLVFVFLFWVIKNFAGDTVNERNVYELGDAASIVNLNSRVASFNHLSMHSILSANFKYKDGNGQLTDHNITLYEIFYYGLEGRYTGEIITYLDSIVDEMCRYKTGFPYCRDNPHKGYARARIGLGYLEYVDSFKREIYKGPIHDEVSRKTRENDVFKQFQWNLPLRLNNGVSINGQNLFLILYTIQYKRVKSGILAA